MAASPYPRLGLTLSALLLTYVFAMNAWVCEDAYISLRTVENLAAGHGLTWNPGERVQAFTHPLWVLLLSAARLLTSEVYLTSIVLSYALLLLTLACLSRACGPAAPWKPLAGCLLLVSSKAFVDYASSGLENGLSYAIAAAFFGGLLYGRLGAPTRRNVLLVFLLAALAFTTRQDTILLYAPALVLTVATGARELRGRIVAPLLLGLAPALAWEVFALVYYGFPFPNPAYAKLGAGIATIDLAAQGLRYFANSLRWDFLTLATIAAALVYSATQRAWERRVAGIGIALYLLYVVRIGGDFMSGRFLAVPFLVALVVLAAIPLRGRSWVAVGTVVLAVLVLAPAPPLATTRSSASLGIDADGIADERGYYFKASGLIHYKRGGVFPDHPGSRAGADLRDDPAAGAITKMIGFYGFFAGPAKTVVDPYGIADPLLARLPVRDREHWRIGHFERALPAGYLESVLGRTNAIEDPRLRLFYDKLRLIVSGPVFRRERFRAILAINSGRYENLLDGYAAR